MSMLTLVANALSMALPDKLIAEIFHSVFYTCIDWLLIFLVSFVFIYAGFVNNKARTVRRIIAGIAAIDSLSLMMNCNFEHAFTIKQVYEGKSIYNVLDVIKLPYELHLAFCYILSAAVAIMLIYKMARTSAFYRRKYTVILLLFIVVLGLDGVSIFANLKVNISIVFYSVMTFAIYYYSIKFYPRSLISSTLQMVLQNSGNGIVCFDENGRHVYSNERIWTMTMLSKDEQISEKSLKERLRFDDNTFTQENFSFKEERIIKGETRYFDIECQKLYDDKHVYIGRYYNVIDMTERVKSYENEVSNAKLANQAKTDYLSRMSHEIRTPVNSIYGMNEMIMRESTEPEIVGYAQDIKTSAEILVGIINDILDLSKIEAGKMEIINEKYEFTTLLENVVSLISIKAKERKLTFSVDVANDIPSVLFGDMARIQQVLINILSNAVKYTPVGIVALTVNCRKRGDDVSLYFEVKDTGIGIKQQDIPKLTDAFERIDQIRNHNIQGTGLGLNITSQFLRLMGSKLEVESKYGIGSTFSFRILQKIENQTPIGEFDLNKSKLRDKDNSFLVAPELKILIVDDNAINRKVFAKLLKQTKVNITEAESGSECLKLVENNYYDMIFLDHMMPEMDGVETLHRMMKMENNKCKNSPVIMLTANAMVGARQEYINEGFTDFLSKPIIPLHLEKMISKYIK